LSASKRRYKKGHPVVDCIYGDQEKESEKTHHSSKGRDRENCAQEESAEVEGACAESRVKKESGARKKDPREARPRIVAGI
jgi:hypothetical protein